VLKQVPGFTGREERQSDRHPKQVAPQIREGRAKAAALTPLSLLICCRSYIGLIHAEVKE
jgi:hypothetical protein